MILIIITALLAMMMITQKRSSDDSTRFGVMTDMHFFPSELVNTESGSYREYIKTDAKLTLESEAVLNAAIDQMIAYKVEFVILAGDVSNEGEKQSHLRLAKLLKKFSDHQIAVFITPGNHDINNPIARSFLSDKAEPVENITAREFEEIYNDFGFKQAYDRDEFTLSYCAAIKPDLHIITLDGNQYKTSAKGPVPNGILPPETVKWAVSRIKESTEKGIRMIGVMHHGLVEHFFDQGRTFAPFLIADFKEIGSQLAKAGLEFVFTGHLHAQDISSASYNQHVIYDIETAALTSTPFAWRLMTLNQEELQINTIYLQDIDYDYGSKLPFREWAHKRVWNGLLALEAHFLKEYNGLTEEQTQQAAPYYARAFMAHFCGDENPSEDDIAFYEKHKSNPESPFYKVASIFKALWTDLPTSDNNLVIPLRKLKHRY